MNIVLADLPARIVWEIKLIWDPFFSYGISLKNWFHKKEYLIQPELVTYFDNITALSMLLLMSSMTFIQTQTVALWS